MRREISVLGLLCALDRLEVGDCEVDRLGTALCYGLPDESNAARTEIEGLIEAGAPKT